MDIGRMRLKADFFKDLKDNTTITLVWIRNLGLDAGALDHLGSSEITLQSTTIDYIAGCAKQHSNYLLLLCNSYNRYTDTVLYLYKSVYVVKYCTLYTG